MLPCKIIQAFQDGFENKPMWKYAIKLPVPLLLRGHGLSVCVSQAWNWQLN